MLRKLRRHASTRAGGCTPAATPRPGAYGRSLDRRFANVPLRYNAAPTQELWAIRQNHDTGERSLDLLRWGLVPYWSKAKPKPAPINAKSETVAKLPMFRDAYRRRRCIMPVDLFFEWKAIKGAKAKQPYAIGMQDGSAFGLAGLWENWKDPTTDEWIRTFAVLPRRRPTSSLPRSTTACP